MSVGMGAGIAGVVMFLGFIVLAVMVVIGLAILFWPKKKKGEPVTASIVPQFHQPVYTPRNPQLDAIDYEVAVAAEALREIKLGEYKHEVIERAKSSFAKA